MKLSTKNIKEMFVTGDIDHKMLSEFLLALKELDRSKGPIRINISSPGGHLDSGFAMFDAMRCTKNFVITRGLGFVGSMAVLLLQGGDLRTITPNTSILCHDVSVSMSHTLGAVKAILAQTSKDRESYIKTLSERSGMSFETVEALCSKESYLTSAEALSNGLVDGIETQRPYDLSWKKQ
jgi:ATP-dependent Clp protease protease subunit